MSKDIHDIAAALRLRLERSEANLFHFLRSCEIEETDNGGNFFCSTQLDGASVLLLTANQTIRVTKGDRRAVQHIDVDSALLFQACQHAFHAAKEG
ncbi:MAG: hypothetical protein AAFX90_20470 [Pseudomonadota bacterium]